MKPQAKQPGNENDSSINFMVESLRAGGIEIKETETISRINEKFIDYLSKLKNSEQADIYNLYKEKMINDLYKSWNFLSKTVMQWKGVKREPISIIEMIFYYELAQVLKEDKLTPKIVQIIDKCLLLTIKKYYWFHQNTFDIKGIKSNTSTNEYISEMEKEIKSLTKLGKSFDKRNESNERNTAFFRKCEELYKSNLIMNVVPPKLGYIIKIAIKQSADLLPQKTQKRLIESREIKLKTIETLTDQYRKWRKKQIKK